MQHAFLFILSITCFSGCASSVTKGDTSNLDPGCIRHCAGMHADCASRDQHRDNGTEGLKECVEAYDNCMGSCSVL
jgi:hypothetical protein